MVAAGGPCCGDPFSATAWLWAEPGLVVYCFGMAFNIYRHMPHFALANRPDRPHMPPLEADLLCDGGLVVSAMSLVNWLFGLRGSCCNEITA